MEVYKIKNNKLIPYKLKYHNNIINVDFKYSEHHTNQHKVTITLIVKNILKLKKIKYLDIDIIECLKVSVLDLVGCKNVYEFKNIIEEKYDVYYTFVMCISDFHKYIDVDKLYNTLCLQIKKNFIEKIKCIYKDKVNSFYYNVNLDLNHTQYEIAQYELLLYVCNMFKRKPMNEIFIFQNYLFMKHFSFNIKIELNNLIFQNKINHNCLGYINKSLYKKILFFESKNNENLIVLKEKNEIIKVLEITKLYHNEFIEWEAKFTFIKCTQCDRYDYYLIRNFNHTNICKICNINLNIKKCLLLYVNIFDTILYNKYNIYSLGVLSKILNKTRQYECCDSCVDFYTISFKNRYNKRYKSIQVFFLLKIIGYYEYNLLLYIIDFLDISEMFKQILKDDIIELY